MTQVVVTGIGAVTPLGVGARTLHERWLAGQSGIEDGEGKASEYEPKEHLSIKEARRADRFTQFAMVAGDEALAEAGWSDELPYDPTRIACIIGTGIGGIGTLEHNHDVLRDSGPKKVSPLSVPLMMSNAAPGALSMRYGLRGHSLRHRVRLRGGGARDRQLREPDPDRAWPTPSSPAAPRRR